MKGVDLVVKAFLVGSISASVRESLDNSLASVVVLFLLVLVVIAVVAVRSKQTQRTFTRKRELRKGW